TQRLEVPPVQELTVVALARIGFSLIGPADQNLRIQRDCFLSHFLTCGRRNHLPQQGQADWVVGDANGHWRALEFSRCKDDMPDNQLLIALLRLTELRPGDLQSVLSIRKAASQLSRLVERDMNLRHLNRLLDVFHYLIIGRWIKHSRQDPITVSSIGV